MDPITTGLQLAFYVLFVASVYQFLRNRGPLELSVMLVFGSFAALFGLTFLNALVPAVAPVARPVLVAILFAQPYLVLRLIDQIHPVSRSIRRITVLGAIAAWQAVVLLPVIATTLGLPMLQSIGIVAAVFYFFAVEIGAAAWFARDSQRRHGVARLRLASAAVATGLFAASILLAGLSSVAQAPGASAADSTTVTRLLALFATMGYFVAFVPPGWLRRFINRAASYQLVRSLVAPPSAAEAGSLWNDLATTAREILGARSVSILPAAPGAPLAVVGDRLPEAAESANGSRISTVELPVRTDREDAERLVAQIEGRPLFVSDDLTLLADLSALTAHAIDREEMLIGLGEGRREAEESRTVRASEARFRALLEADPNAILALDEESHVTWATRQAGDLFGCAVDRLIGVKLADLVAVHNDEMATVAGERAVYRSEATGRLVDGTHFPAEIARRTFELDGRPFQVAVISDVSWRHEADQIRDRFLGVLSHELRTPVTSIYGGTQLLLGRGARLDPETRNELLVSVAAEAERLQRNLLSNAAKYSGPGSTVEVSMEDAEDEVLVHVRDDGPGIVADDAERLFGLYYRAAPQASTAPGAGIGLFVCRELVATMGGRIWAKPLPGKGAEFGFSIPGYVDEMDLVPEGDEPIHVFEREQEPTQASATA